MKKKGFTLIELMVVIVIMGILAAVAVPKLFGQIAKSKTSEISTNASAYKTTQESYVTTANKLGNGTDIGYKDPGSNNFTYNFADAGKWEAVAKVGLNDCEIGTKWGLEAKLDSKTGVLSWIASFTKAGDNCAYAPLTPEWANMGSKGTGM